jgi:hypothetical protein
MSVFSPGLGWKGVKLRIANVDQEDEHDVCSMSLAIGGLTFRGMFVKPSRESSSFVRHRLTQPRVKRKVKLVFSGEYMNGLSSKYRLHGREKDLPWGSAVADMTTGQEQ